MIFPIKHFLKNKPIIHVLLSELALNVGLRLAQHDHDSSRYALGFEYGERRQKKGPGKIQRIKKVYASTIPDQWVLALSSNRGWVLRRQKKGNLHFGELRGT